MLAKIFGFILNIINIIIMFIINMVFTIFAPIDITGFSGIFSSFFALLSGSTRFLYFIIGPSTSIFITIFGILWTLKHIVLPVTNFIRKILIK